MVDVFPAPLGPSRLKNSPWPMSRLRPSIATRSDVSGRPIIFRHRLVFPTFWVKTFRRSRTSITSGALGGVHDRSLFQLDLGDVTVHGAIVTIHKYLSIVTGQNLVEPRRAANERHTSMSPVSPEVRRGPIWSLARVSSHVMVEKVGFGVGYVFCGLGYISHVLAEKGWEQVGLSTSARGIHWNTLPGSPPSNVPLHSRTFDPGVNSIMKYRVIS